jgi:hypothetical protein
LRGAADEIAARGAGLVFVGNGRTERAAQFAREKGLERPGISVVTDTRAETYRAAGFERSVAGVLGSPRAAVAAVRAATRGFVITGVDGDPWELGGVFVMKPPAEMAYRRAAAFAGDHAPLEEILASL